MQPIDPVSGPEQPLVFFYAAEGEPLASFRVYERVERSVTPVMKQAQTVLVIGSVRQWGVLTSTYFPYGEEQWTTVQDRMKYGTYYRDGVSVFDYADQRYYWSMTGAFVTPDPSDKNWDLTDPGSWNAYVYVQGDPVNANDPNGENLARLFGRIWGGISGFGSSLGGWIGSAFGFRQPQPVVTSTISYPREGGGGFSSGSAARRLRPRHLRP